MRRSDLFQDAFTKCVHIRKFLDKKGPELHYGHKNNISFDSDLPKKNSRLPTICLKSLNFVGLELIF